MMRVAVLADIHGNLTALEAVVADLQRVTPDIVYVAGDFQNRGPNPFEVTRFVASQGWRLLRGNHEDYVIQQSEGESPPNLTDYYSWLPARWTAGLTRDSVRWIRNLPIADSFHGPDGRRVTVAHGSERSNNEGFFPRTAEAKAREMLGSPPPALLCCGHSHLPLIRWVDDTLLFNVGSVGFPFDGDQRASYGVVTWLNDHWDVEIRRVSYSVDDVFAAFNKVNFYEGVGPLSHIIRREIESARPHLTPFYFLFGNLLRSEEIEINDAVKSYISMADEEIAEKFASIFAKK
jgi:predicted phosphodiesterase